MPLQVLTTTPIGNAATAIAVVAATRIVLKLNVCFHDYIFKR